MNKKIEKKHEQTVVNTSTQSAEEKLSQRFKNLPYSTDKIGQVFVIHIPQTQRDHKKYNK